MIPIRPRRVVIDITHREREFLNADGTTTKKLTKINSSNMGGHSGEDKLPPEGGAAAEDKKE
jgi:hypothetical protein